MKVPHAPYTGGPLNALNRIAGVSAPHRSVRIVALIRAHRPRSAAELEELIASHIGGSCRCGVVSQGTVRDFGRLLYEAQRQHWGRYDFSLAECTVWMYDLFVHQSMRGERMETTAAALLSAELVPHFFVQAADAFLDCELRIDLEVLRGSSRIAGVQVKPWSFYRMDERVIASQEKRHARADLPVFVLCYDSEGKFVGVPELVRAIRAT